MIQAPHGIDLQIFIGPGPNQHYTRRIEGPCECEWQGDRFVVVGPDPADEAGGPRLGARRVHSIEKQMLGKVYILD